MNFYPAIDIKDGRFIRLKQGRLDEVTVYGNNPVEIAKKFSNAGAKWIHVVDIDGAFRGKGINQKVILDIKKNSKTKIQVGGGIRSKESASFYLNNGIDRVVLGTIALENPNIRASLKTNIMDAFASENFGNLDAIDMDYIMQKTIFGHCVYG